MSDLHIATEAPAIKKQKLEDSSVETVFQKTSQGQTRKNKKLKPGKLYGIVRLNSEKFFNCLQNFLLGMQLRYSLYGIDYTPRNEHKFKLLSQLGKEKESSGKGKPGRDIWGDFLLS